MGLSQLKKPEHKKHRSPGNTSKTPDALSLKPKRCRTARRKENFEEQPNRTVAENKIPPKVEGTQAAKLGSTGK
jgi:hypothetical protein